MAIVCGSRCNTCSTLVMICSVIFYLVSCYVHIKAWRATASAIITFSLYPVPVQRPSVKLYGILPSSGATLSPPQFRQARWTKEIFTENKGKMQSQGGPGPPLHPHGPLPHRAVALPFPDPPIHDQGAPERSPPSLGVPSWRSSLMEGARGCFRSQAFPMLLHGSLIWMAQARHLAKR